MGKIVVSFTIDDEKDRDLKRWLDGLDTGKRSEAIRETLRIGLARGGVTIGDVYEAIKGLERKLGAGVIVAHSESEAQEDTPADVLAALDGLGL